MNFGKAVEAIKIGKKARRSIWSPVVFMHLLPSIGYGEESRHMRGGNIEMTFQPTIVVNTENMGYGVFVPKHTDILAEDWEIK
jgi:hypothetical protein